MKQLKTNKGFSLVELLVAITLLTVGILSMVQMQVVAIQSNAHANRLSVATGLAQEVMDDILAWDVNNPPVADIFTTPTTTAAYDRLSFSTPTKSVSMPGTDIFTASYTITLVQPDLTSAFIAVTVTGSGKTVTLTGIKRIS